MYNLTQSSEMVGVARQTLYKYLRQLNIKPSRIMGMPVLSKAEVQRLIGHKLKMMKIRRRKGGNHG